MAVGSAGFGDTYALAVLNHTLVSGGAALDSGTAPTVIYVALTTVEPTSGDPGTEVTASGYGAVSVGRAFTAVGQTADNDSNIDFGTLTAGVTIVGITVWKSATVVDVDSADYMYFLEIAPVTFVSGEIPRIPASTLTITVA